MRRLSLGPNLWATGAVAAVLLVLSGGCDGDTKYKIYWPEAGPGARLDGAIYLDGSRPDIGKSPDVRIDEGSPTIEILDPKEGELLVGDTLTVRVKVTDPDGVDDQTVELELQGGAKVIMGVTAEPTVYSALVDISSIQGAARLIVTAADLLNNSGSAVRTFERDPGPVIVFLSPAEDSRHKGSLSVQVAVADRVEVTSFEVRIGTTVLTLKETASAAQRKVYAGTVKFDDAQFPVPLSGRQVLIAVATNANGATSSVQRNFVIDDAGPGITIISPSPGDLIGALIEIQAKVDDLAGVLGSSVVAVVGRDINKRRVPLAVDPTAPGVYSAQFDTRTLDDWDLWPVISVRAADRLGNESHRDITVGVDNGQPIVSLDPPTDMYAVRDVDGRLECSRPFDPVGDDAVSDGEAVPQIATIRVRIEDQGNGSTVPSAEWVPRSGLDDNTVQLFVLDDTAQALVVDTTGDGFCDSVNPEIVPLGSQPLPGQAIAVNLTPITATGAPDFRPDGQGSVEHGGVCNEGTDSDEPDPLCDVTQRPPTAPSFSGRPPVDMTYALQNGFPKKPSLYVPAPIADGPVGCAGLPFDFKANEVADGWVCVTAMARDNLGHLGVARPMRLWVDNASRGWLKGQTPPASAGTPPDCTGTLDLSSGRVDATKGCTFRVAGDHFPQIYAPRSYRKID